MTNYFAEMLNTLEPRNNNEISDSDNIVSVAHIARITTYKNDENECKHI